MDLDEGAEGLENRCEILDRDSILPLSGQQQQRCIMSGVDTIVPVLVCHECCIYMELVRQWTGITIITLNYGVMMVVDLCLDDGVDTGHH